MASLASRAKTRIAAQRLSGKLSTRYATQSGVVSGTVAGRNLANVGGRLARADGLEDYAAGAPVTLTNVGTPGMALYAPEGGALAVQFVGTGGGSGGGGGVTDHGALSGLTDDDHLHYLTEGRGDLRYVPLARTVTAGTGLSGGGALGADISLSLPSSVAGAGLAYTAGVLSVNAGTLISVASDNVNLANGSAQYQVPVTGATPFTPAFTALSTFAGAGMSFTGGQFAVGQGAGLTVSLTTVALTTPGSLDIDSTNTATGNHKHAVVTSSDPNATAAILATTTAGLLTLRNGAFRQAAQSQATFASGFAGSGWRVDYGITTASKASAEFDDLTVRGRMRVYELLIQQIRATNGSLFVSSASKVVSVTTSTDPTWTVNGVQLTFNGSDATFSATIYQIATADPGDTGRELYHGFLPGDVIRAQQVNWNGSTYDFVMQSNLEVTGVTDLFNYQAARVSGNAPAAGYDYVRLGNSSDTSRQGAVYLTSDDSAAPFIDIVDGIKTHADWNSADVKRVRVGKLTGISDVAFGGPLAGYGLYGNNVYLKGMMVITGGSLGGLAAADVNGNTTTIDGGKITANSVTANQIAANTIGTTLLNFTPVLTGSIVASINATTEGLKIAANLIQIDGTTTFSSGYNPSTKLGAGDAAADINANTTTIDGGKITTGSITAGQIAASTITANKLNITSLSAITANLGSVTAGQIVVGSTNKLWLNDSADGALRIGGSTKTAAPFQVSAAGHLDAIDAEFGTLQIDSTGAYVAAQNTFSMAAGYKFRYNTANGGGVVARWIEASSASMWLLNNKNALTDAVVDGSADSTITMIGAAASAKSSAIDLRAERIVSGSAKFTGLSLLNTSSARKATIHADAFVLAPEAGGEYAIWHSHNDGVGSGLDADTVDGVHLSNLAQLNAASNSFVGDITTSGIISLNSTIKFTNPLSTDPLYSSIPAGQIWLYLVDGTSGRRVLKARGKGVGGGTAEITILTTGT